MFFNSNDKPGFANCYKKETKPHKFCPGCGHGIILKELGFAIDDLKIANKTLIGIDIGCSLLAWDFFDVNTVQTHHGRTVPVISGYKKIANENIGIVYVGDGGAYAIGLQALISAAYRNDPITVIVVNNTLYGMTGGQMSPTTLTKETTTTSQSGKNTKPFFGPELISKVCSEESFVARASVSEPLVLREALKKAIINQVENKSFSMLEVLSMCPVNWKKDAEDSLKFLDSDMSKAYKIGVIK